MSTPTLRRLDDRERYWGLTWPGWVSAIAGAGGLYLAVRFSPLSTKPTITITLFILALVGMLVYGISGQALSPGHQLLAILRYQRSHKLLELSDRADRCGLVLDGLPDLRLAARPTAGAGPRLEDLLAPDDRLLVDDEQVHELGEEQDARWLEDEDAEYADDPDTCDGVSDDEQVD